MLLTAAINAFLHTRCNQFNHHYCCYYCYHYHYCCCCLVLLSSLFSHVPSLQVEPSRAESAPGDRRTHRKGRWVQSVPPARPPHSILCHFRHTALRCDFALTINLLPVCVSLFVCNTLLPLLPRLPPRVQQAAAQAEMDRMSVLAMRRKLAMGDLESDEEPHHAPAAPAPAADSSFLYTRMDILQRSVSAELPPGWLIDDLLVRCNPKCRMYSTCTYVW